MHSVKLTLTVLFLLLVVTATEGQDFDADSIYYSAIPKTVPVNTHPKRIFTDTTRHDNGIHYFFNVQVGPLVGCNDCSLGKEVTFTSSTLHGVTIGRKLRTGIGAGFDSYYSWQTLPLFGSVSWDLIGTKNTQAIYLQLQYGWSILAWRKELPWDYGSTNVEGGRMVSPQIGYRVKYHDIKISLSVGTKFQRVYTYFETPSYYYLDDGTVMQGSPNKTTIKESMNRLMFALTVGWK